MSELRVYFRLTKLEGLSLDKIPGATKISYTLNFQKSNWEMCSDPSRERIPDFSDEILAYDMPAGNYEKDILYITLLATIKKQELAVAVLNVPIQVCPQNRRVHGKFLFTTPRYPGRVKGSIDLHVSRDKNAKPFSVEKARINMAVLERFMTPQHTPEPPTQPVSKGGTKHPSVAPSVGPSIPPEQRLTPQQLQGIWTAINMAPPEVWELFQDKEFLMDCLTYYRVPGSRVESA